MASCMHFLWLISLLLHSLRSSHLFFLLSAVSRLSLLKCLEACIEFPAHLEDLALRFLN